MNICFNTVLRSDRWALKVLVRFILTTRPPVYWTAEPYDRANGSFSIFILKAGAWYSFDR